MTPAQIELVQKSWTMVAATDAQNAGRSLCRQLLEIVPEIKSEFCYRTDKIQPGKISSLISYIIRKLHRTDAIITELETLARHHLHYYMQDEQYIGVGKALLDTLATGLGDKWNRDLQYAWATCYTTLAEVVMNASRVHECVHEEELALCG